MLRTCTTFVRTCPQLAPPLQHSLYIVARLSSPLASHCPEPETTGKHETRCFTKNSHIGIVTKTSCTSIAHKTKRVDRHNHRDKEGSPGKPLEVLLDEVDEAIGGGVITVTNQINFLSFLNETAVNKEEAEKEKEEYNGIHRTDNLAFVNYFAFNLPSSLSNLLNPSQSPTSVYPLHKNKAQDSPPLVKGVDVPDDALSEDLHLIHGNESAQGEGGDTFYHDGVGGTVPLEYLVWEDAFLLVLRHVGFLQLSLHLGLSLTLHESLRLSKEVGQEELRREERNCIILKLSERKEK
ncbi:hypothetical protein E2C01_018155 [Portunus trituberculatus]|uniref:Uncharacterized protein n=1 Tax=Portunus trituberculatus TaxID=210409 RepID=A0A5B7DVN6_PORTR|nr:hypothetical protein [Portunus trituberculatus]